MYRLRFILKFMSFFGFLSIPHILNKLGANPTIFIAWDGVAKEFWENTGHHLSSLAATFLMGVEAAAASLILGTFLGLLFAYFNKWIGFFETLTKFIWSIPLIVVAVYLNILIGNVHLYVIITGVFLGIFPIVSFVYHKAIEAHDGIVSLIATFNLSRWTEFVHLRFREVWKNITIPLEQSVPLTYIGITMGEYTVGRVAGSNSFGLGSDFQFAMNYSKFEKVYVAIILMIFLVFLSGEIFYFGSKVNAFLKKLKSGVYMQAVETTLIVTMAAVVIAGCFESERDSSKGNLVLQLNWIDDPTFTGEYVAKEKFWFLKRQNVTIKQGGIGVDPIAMVLSKKADFAVVGADKALIAISDGKPIKIVSVDLQRNPVGWIARRQLKVLNFDDIRGRHDLILGDKVGTEISAILELIIKRKQIDVVPKSVSFDFSYFLANEKAVYPVYLNEEPVKAEVVHGIPINEIDPSLNENGGIRLYGNVIIAHEEFIGQHPMVVRNFVDGLSSGWRYAKENPADAMNVVKSYVKGDKEYLRLSMQRTINYATSMYGLPTEPGHMEYTAWERTVALLRDAKLLTKNVDLKTALYMAYK